MPNAMWHKAKRIHNKNLNIHLNKTLTNYEDWKIVTLFYTTLHHVDEYLSEYPRNIHPENHNERRIEINNHIRLIRKKYRLIKNISEDARYRKNISKNDFIKFLKTYANTIKFFSPVICTKCGYNNRLNTGNCKLCRTHL